MNLSQLAFIWTVSSTTGRHNYILFFLIHNTCSVGEDGGLRRQRSAFEEDVDGAMFSPVGALAEGGGGGGHRPLCLPPPLIPSPPFTLSRSPTPQLDTSHHFQLPPPPSSRQLSATPSRSTPSPTFPPVSSGQRRQQKSGNFTPASSGGQRKSLTFSPVSSAERNNSIHRQKYVEKSVSDFCVFQTFKHFCYIYAWIKLHLIS